MIVGIGIDIVECARLKKSIDRYGRTFIDHFCTEAEQRLAPASPSAQMVYYAGRWAAKEACSKALGTGIGEQCAWKEMTVDNLPSGQPRLTLSGEALNTANRLGIKTIHLSISHENSYATAMVVTEKD